jgi:ubiquitin-conjugating enzyme E2 W
MQNSHFFFLLGHRIDAADNMIPSIRLSMIFIQLLGLVLLSKAAREPTFLSTKELKSFRLAHPSFVSASANRPLLSEKHTALLVRGGGIELSSGAEGGLIVTKLRNAIRGLLQFGDKKVPLFSSILRSWVTTVESLTGLKLLPVKKSKKSKKKGGKETKTEKKKQVAYEADEEETVEQAKEKVEKPKKAKAALKKPSATTQNHLASSIKNTNPNYRIQRELKELITSPPPNISVQVGSNIRVWIITMIGANNTIYEGDVFKLRVSFPAQYPTVPPSVYFLQGYVPLHEHVYTNGDICLSLLGKDWRPTMTAQSIAVSILSILSSAQSKSLPMDNSRHASNKPGEYQKDWVYHDDNC